MRSATLKQRFCICLLVACPALTGCQLLRGDADPPPVLADHDPYYARRLELGKEVELIQPVQVVDSLDVLGLDVIRPAPPNRNGAYRGVLPAGTRLRVEHVWRQAGDSATGIGGATQTRRMLPNHDPLYRPLSSVDLPGSWAESLEGDPINAYVLPLLCYRVVPDDERTPEDQIKPLTKRQE